MNGPSFAKKGGEMTLRKYGFYALGVQLTILIYLQNVTTLNLLKDSIQDASYDWAAFIAGNCEEYNNPTALKTKCAEFIKTGFFHNLTGSFAFNPTNVAENFESLIIYCVYARARTKATKAKKDGTITNADVLNEMTLGEKDLFGRSLDSWGPHASLSTNMDIKKKEKEKKEKVKNS